MAERSSRKTHFADRFLDAAERCGAPVCVGLDPVLERLPHAVLGDDPLDRIEAFCRGVIDAVAGVVPAVKPQLACFERYGSAGYAVYESVVELARSAGLMVIADGKRGDIGVSASHYAAGLIVGNDYAVGSDALTVNAYLGLDGLEPFAEAAAGSTPGGGGGGGGGRGLFALVRTSNPGGDALQSLPLADGRTVAEAVADAVAELGERYLGERGYSLVGAVVGATKPADAAALRARMPHQLFLVPGYGAQGGSADDVRACFHPDGIGAIITASRSVLYAADPADAQWQGAVAKAAAKFRNEIAHVLQRRPV